MITGDLDEALATQPTSAGTWRPVPPGDEAGQPAGDPARYATSIAFRLAHAPAGAAGSADSAAGSPRRIAAELAGRLEGLDWAARTEVTGGGYLTVTVTPDALARLAVRITQAGPACARSPALHGATVTAPASPGLAGARSWEQARQRLVSHVTGRLAEAAGAAVTWIEERERTGASPAPDSPAPPVAEDPVADGLLTQGPVAEGIAYAGPDAIIWMLLRAQPGGRIRIDPAYAAAQQAGNPAYAVRYAHAHAASVLRQAADLGHDRGGPAQFQPWLLAHPRERALLYELSWLPERVAGAARRRQPDVLARYLEGLAEAFLSCQESCPAAWPGMPPAASRDGTGDGPDDAGARTGEAGPAPPGQAGTGPADPFIAARLWLAAAARAALAAGLGLLGVDAPDRP